MKKSPDARLGSGSDASAARARSARTNGSGTTGAGQDTAGRKNTDPRSRSTKSASRQPRSAQNRVLTSSRVLNDAERVAMLTGNAEGVLPTIPDIQGYHTFWATTNNPADPIHRRLLAGYELIKASDVANWPSGYLVSTGEYAGCLGVREMIALKLPDHLYQAVMKELHHRQPIAEESVITERVDMLKEQALQMGGKLSTGDDDPATDGIAAMGKDVAAPEFA